ncbi:hypothetical protein LCGC14_2280480 [marine sediment metagenome]|uniref:Uncharacterized protein n=1 Tax=marine sediment metagenome TaxID=412755 RepID=A0A0F9DGK3_9ZZZZ
MRSDCPVRNTFVNRLIGRSEGARKTRLLILDSLFRERAGHRPLYVTTLRSHVWWIFHPSCKRCGDRHDSGRRHCYVCQWHFIETFLSEATDAK